MTDDFKAKEAAVRRIFLRFNDQQDKIKVIFEDFGNGIQSMSFVDSNTMEILLYIPSYMLNNTEIFQEVHSFLTTKLRG